MFNTFNTYKYDGPSTIVEERAPTDESVRLLKEMEEAARNKVEETIVVADTTFECKIQKILDAISYQDIYHVSYRLNGRKQTLDIRIDKHKRLLPAEVATIIRDKIAVDIADEMLVYAFNEAAIMRGFS